LAWGSNQLWRKFDAMNHFTITAEDERKTLDFDPLETL
jgi:hypothetical protein